MAFTFTTDGQLESVTRPTGTGTPAEAIVSTYGYDTAGRLDAISHAQNGSYLAEYGYTLDATGNRERIDITGSAVASGYEEHTYDALDRVDYARYVDGGTATFTYDANGNRDTVTAGGVTTTYAYDDLGQLVGITDNDALNPVNLAIAYDANGNRRTVTDTTTSTVTREYTWDWANRLTQAEVNGTTTSYAYLGDDTRASQTTSSGTTEYLYDRASGLPQVVDDGTDAYLHDVTGNLVSIDGTDTPTYPLQDGLGSTRLSLDDTGSVLGTSEWDAWGTLRSSTGSSYGFGWAGQQHDAGSDLTYLRARYYSSGTASFLSRDTVQPNARGTTGYNPYAYANGNPVTVTDPSGHSVMDACSRLGPFGCLAYVFECYLSGNCRYQGQWGDFAKLDLVLAEQTQCGAAVIASDTRSVDFRTKLCPGDVAPNRVSPTLASTCSLIASTLQTGTQDLGSGCGGSGNKELAKFWDYVWYVSFDLTITEFETERASPTRRESGINWTNDHCSIPDWARRVPKYGEFPYEYVYEPACDRHDFGYRNTAWTPEWYLNEQGVFITTYGALRAAVDGVLRDDMFVLCYLQVQPGGEQTTCVKDAGRIYDSVRLGGWKAWRQK